MPLTSKVSSTSKKSILLNKWKYTFKHKQKYLIVTKKKGDFRFNQHRVRVYNVLLTIAAKAVSCLGSRQAFMVRNVQHSLHLVHHIHGRCILTKNVKTAPPPRHLEISRNQKRSFSCKRMNLMLKVFTFLIVLMTILSLDLKKKQKGRVNTFSYLKIQIM